MKDDVIKKRELALNSSSRPILQSLLCEYDHDIREGLAKNPRCPSNLLYELFVLECHRSLVSNDIQFYIIMNPNCPKENVVRFYFEFINNIGKDGADKFINELNQMLDKFALLLDDPDLPFTTLRDLTNLRYLPTGSSIVLRDNSDNKRENFYKKEEAIVMRAKEKIRRVVDENKQDYFLSEQSDEIKL